MAMYGVVSYGGCNTGVVHAIPVESDTPEEAKEVAEGNYTSKTTEFDMEDDYSEIRSVTAV